MKRTSNFGWFKVSQVELTPDNTELSVTDPRTGKYWSLELPYDLVHFSGQFLLAHQEQDAHIQLYDLLLAML